MFRKLGKGPYRRIIPFVLFSVISAVAAGAIVLALSNPKRDMSTLIGASLVTAALLGLTWKLIEAQGKLKK